MAETSWKHLICKDLESERIREAFIYKDINKINPDKINNVMLECFEFIEDKYPLKRISIIQLALYTNWYEALKLLLNNEIIKNHKQYTNKLTNKEELLHIAIIYHCDIRILKLLIKYNSDIEAYSSDLSSNGTPLDYYDKKPIHIAIISNNIKALKLLLELNVNIESTIYTAEYKDCDQTINIPLTPIQVACYCNNIKMFKILINHGADINAKNFAERGIIEFATATLSYNVLKFLKDKGFNINQNNYIKDFINNLDKYYFAYNTILIKKIIKLLN